MQPTQQKVLQTLQRWGENNAAVRAMILTSSRANPYAKPDHYSDYDVELYVSDKKPFMNDKWLAHFGEVMILWPLKPMPTWNENSITRLVLFKNEMRIDFQILDSHSLDPKAFDNGYRVLVDKDELTKNIPEPTYTEFIIKKPTEEEYMSLVNEFFWDGTYVPKSLWRNELCHAKYMFDSIIRFNYFQQMIEWYIGMQHDWSVSTNKFGRYFKRYLDRNTWAELESTFAGADIEDNWKAFFNMVKLFRRLAREVASTLNYEYPEQTDRDVTGWYQKVRETK
ncbi:MAG: aminoglycoside 6-adenylyltransferase [Candidatus Peregrinibacteria bacterium]